ncbi:MAG: MFS transporter [Gemmatimonadales bacterium]|nr:MFS transporter [Gemmatimonadales bacterium]
MIAAARRDYPGRVFSALRSRNYRVFLSGQLVSLIGTWMQTVAQSWLVYRLTGSAVLLGTVGFASQIPIFLLSPLGGMVADRWERRRVLLVTQSCMMVLALALAMLTLTGRIEVWHVLAFAALLGTANGFDIPARQSFIVELVERRDLLNAIALNSSMFNGARVVGPAVAGIIVATVGEGWCFFANAVSYVAVLASLLALRLPRESRERPPASPLAEIAEGWRFVANTAPIRAILLLLGVVSLTGMPYAVLMPVMAEDVLHAGARGLGILMGAAGTGALIGALALARRNSLRGLGRIVALAALSFGVFLILFSLSRQFWLSVALLLPMGLSMLFQMASSNTLVQSMVPDRLRGRVMSVYSMTFMGMAPIGALLAGVAAGSLGAPVTIAAGGAVSIVAALLFWRRLPELTPEARRLVREQAEGIHRNP